MQIHFTTENKKTFLVFNSTQQIKVQSGVKATQIKEDILSGKSFSLEKGFLMSDRELGKMTKKDFQILTDILVNAATKTVASAVIEPATKTVASAVIEPATKTVAYRQSKRAKRRNRHRNQSTQNHKKEIKIPLKNYRKRISIAIRDKKNPTLLHFLIAQRELNITSDGKKIIDLTDVETNLHYTIMLHIDKLIKEQGDLSWFGIREKDYLLAMY